MEKVEKQQCKVIMKFTGFLVALFINKRTNTWPTAMNHMFLLDTDQVTMMFYYDLLSSESYSPNPAITPVQYFSLKMIAFPFINECAFNLVYTKPGENINLRKYISARGITAISCDYIISIILLNISFCIF